MRITSNPINNYSTMNNKSITEGSSFNTTKEILCSEMNQLSENK